MIKFLTVTGADNSVQPGDLLNLSNEFPFVEWGILLSRSSQGQNRFPSFDWMEKLFNLWQAGNNEKPENMLLSGHLCGAYVREIMLGNTAFIYQELPFWSMFSRIQINTHGIPHDVNYQRMVTQLKNISQETGKQFIFQYDNANSQALFEAKKYEVNCAALFDLSHGAGVLPSNWPRPIDGIHCGYAGGLSPDNMESQIAIINKRVEDVDTWIDLETHVRSNHDHLFDLDKVRRCLQIVSNHI